MKNTRCITFMAAFVAIAIPGSFALAQDPPPAPPTATVTETAPLTPTSPTAAENGPASATPALEQKDSQDTKVVPAFVMPEITPDTAIFRRTPVIDGLVEDGEWDTYYTFNANGWDATTYADWDGVNLYIGVKSTRPVDLMTIIDANSDGWFHGEDNYEFRTSGACSDTMTLTVSKYDSKNAKVPTVTPVSQSEAGLVTIKSSRSDTYYMIEMMLPPGLVKEFKMTPGRKFGLQVCLNAGDSFSGWVPSKDIGDTKECTLVAQKLASLDPLNLSLVLRSERIARGDEVVGKFHITNSGTKSLDVRSFVIGGEGKAGEYLSSQKVRTEGLAAKRHLTQDVRSVVPSDMRLGNWAIGAEVRSGSERLGSALVSFEVVEPFDLDLKLPTKLVMPDVKDVTFAIAVRNNTRGAIRGNATITLPVGWELWRNVGTKEVSVSYGGMGSATFKAKPPFGASGDIPVKVSVTMGSRTLIVNGKIVMATP